MFCAWFGIDPGHETPVSHRRLTHTPGEAIDHVQVFIAGPVVAKIVGKIQRVEILMRERGNHQRAGIGRQGHATVPALVNLGGFFNDRRGLGFAQCVDPVDPVIGCLCLGEPDVIQECGGGSVGGYPRFHLHEGTVGIQNEGQRTREVGAGEAVKYYAGAGTCGGNGDSFRRQVGFLYRIRTRRHPVEENRPAIP